MRCAISRTSERESHQPASAESRCCSRRRNNERAQTEHVVYNNACERVRGRGLARVETEWKNYETDVTAMPPANLQTAAHCGGRNVACIQSRAGSRCIAAHHSHGITKASRRRTREHFYRPSASCTSTDLRVLNAPRTLGRLAIFLTLLAASSAGRTWVAT